LVPLSLDLEFTNGQIARALVSASDWIERDRDLVISVVASCLEPDCSISISADDTEGMGTLIDSSGKTIARINGIQRVDQMGVEFSNALGRFFERDIQPETVNTLPAPIVYSTR